MFGHDLLGNGGEIFQVAADAESGGVEAEGDQAADAVDPEREVRAVARMSAAARTWIQATIAACRGVNENHRSWDSGLL